MRWTMILVVCVLFVAAAGAAMPAESPATIATRMQADDGLVWAWGANDNGRLGDNTTTPRITPVQVVGPGGSGFLHDAVLISAGEAHSFALRADGTLLAWGANWAGQLGDGTTDDRYTPVQVVGPGGNGFLTDITQVSGGIWHTVALRADGTVWSWGNNYAGALGDGTTTSRQTPVQVVGPGGSGFLTDIVQVSAGASYSLALAADGTAWAWGDNWAGQLGDGTTTERFTPVQVRRGDGTFLGAITAVSGHRFHSLALGADGTAWAWGENWAGQLGDGTTTMRLGAVRVIGADGNGFLTGVAAIHAGDSHSLALKTDGTAWTWGSNAYGQLGDGTTTDRHAPVKVVGPGGSGFLTGLVTVASGESTNFALTGDGTAWGWGYNGFGNLGDGTSTDRHTPVQPVGITALTHVSVAWQHTIAVGAGVPPAPPRQLTAQPGGELFEIDLAWDAPLYTGGALTGFRIYRSEDADGPYALHATVGPNAHSHADTGALLTTYHYRVSAVNAIAEGDASESACSKPFPWLVVDGDGLCWAPSPPL